MATERMPILPEGYRTIVAELQRLKSVERPAVVKAIEIARAHGDLKENAEYHAAKDKQGMIEARLADLEGRVGRAEVIDPKKLSGDRVIFGATVTLIDENDAKITYQVVSDIEADIKLRRISYISPLGHAMIGHSVGEEIEVTTPKGLRFYEIIKVVFK